MSTFKHVYAIATSTDFFEIHLRASTQQPFWKFVYYHFYILSRQLGDGFGPDSLSEAEGAPDHLFRPLPLHLGPAVLRPEPAPDRLQVHKRGVDSRRRPLQAFPGAVLR